MHMYLYNFIHELCATLSRLLLSSFVLLLLTKLHLYTCVCAHIYIYIDTCFSKSCL